MAWLTDLLSQMFTAHGRAAAAAGAVATPPTQAVQPAPTPPAAPPPPAAAPAVAAHAPGPGTTAPFLLFDTYAGDLGAAPTWSAVAADSRMLGIIIKATQGTTYSPTWFQRNWPLLKGVAHDELGDRYGRSWLRGCYHFLNFFQDGKAQAVAYQRAVEKAGGWDLRGDIIPIVDVERGRDTASGKDNFDASRQQVIDCTSAYIETIKHDLGRRVMLYGRGAQRDLGISTKMGADIAWNPAYTAAMVPMDKYGWPVTDIALWQYAGDGVGNASKHHLPLKIDAFGARGDMSVVVDGNQKPELLRTIARLCG